MAGDRELSFRVVGDIIYAYDAAVVEDVAMLASSLSVIYSGVACGQIFKGRLKPEHPLALFVGRSSEVVPEVELSLEDAINYLRRQDIDANQFAEGINVVKYRGLAIGYVKRIGMRCNNMYPKALRIQKL